MWMITRIGRIVTEKHRLRPSSASQDPAYPYHVCGRDAPGRITTDAPNETAHTRLWEVNRESRETEGRDASNGRARSRASTEWRRHHARRRSRRRGQDPRLAV